ncbi:MAG: ABC transporter substrate-binding protein [Oscillospiraceae bacterium]|nr:ABC transporter substrate-binding protein [Oscillospiraceae bacterium]
MTRRFSVSAFCFLWLVSCGKSDMPEASEYGICGQMQLEYATQFGVDYCDNGCALIHIAEEDYLFVPTGCSVPENNTLPVIFQPSGNIYLASSSAMDLFDAIGGMDAVSMTSTDKDGWSLPNVRQAMEHEKLVFIGKYSAPDYEALTESDCPLAIENMMISHSPSVREQIESLGIPVIVERSSYEQHPLGRMEWMKLYGLLLGKEETAESVFQEKAAVLQAVESDDIPPEEQKTAAFFSITTNGSVTIRKPGDYISQMIQLAGGQYIFAPDMLHVDDNALSTMNIQMESFYANAKDADILIYNSTIEGQLNSISQLIEKSSVFQDFRAVQNDNVWCTEQNFYQQTSGAADMIADLRKIFCGQADTAEQLHYLHRIH